MHYPVATWLYSIRTKHRNSFVHFPVGVKHLFYFTLSALWEYSVVLKLFLLFNCVLFVVVMWKIVVYYFPQMCLFICLFDMTTISFQTTQLYQSASYKHIFICVFRYNNLFTFCVLRWPSSEIIRMEILKFVLELCCLVAYTCTMNFVEDFENSERLNNWTKNISGFLKWRYGSRINFKTEEDCFC